ncbi:hypothetical protein AVEN_56765-1 [Araneus ventricosus]|uniref:Uncharacterized protein n=1 Tax=Araneus ventricosus TaxID=182803 RepID=A0A4Y2EV49_ARAVE|nr:hypothetical protein AVEN_56765-1 [Araneus ventricosus]
MPKRKRGITGDAASRREAIRKRERRVVETEEERSRRLSTMAQRGQDRRAEVTEEQRNRRLALELFRTEEHNCGEMDNLCLKCGGLYFRDEKNTRGIYTHCCHNGNIIEQASVYPVEMKGLMD